MDRIDHRPALCPAIRSCPLQVGVAWIITLALAIGVLTTAAAAQDHPEHRTILNQKSFSFVDEVIRLLGPREQAIALHRVLGIDQSLTMSQLSQENRLVLINPHRVLFNDFGFVDTGEFLATTLRVRGSHEAEAAVSASTVHVSEHGYIALMTPGVTTEAVVIAAVSTTPSDAEQKILFDFMSDGLIRYAIGESELDHFTGVDGKALAKASSDGERHEAGPGQMLMNARSAADIQRSVMNTGNVTRARRLVVENASIRLVGESPPAASVRLPSSSLSYENASSKPFHKDLEKTTSQVETPTAMVNPALKSSNHDALRASGKKSTAMASMSFLHKRLRSRPPAVANKSLPRSSEPTLQQAVRAEGKSGTKGKMKAQKTIPHAQAQQPPSVLSIPPQPVLPDWMKYLPKSEGTTDSPAVP